MAPAADLRDLYDAHRPALQNSLYATYRRMRDEAPVYRDERHDQWVLTRYHDVASALQAPETYANAGVDESKLLMPMIVYMDAEKHKAQRNLLSRVFTPNRVTALEPGIRRTTQRLLEESAAAPRCNFMRSFASQLPSIVICQMIGIPPEQRPAFLESTEAMIETGLEAHPIAEPAARIYRMFATLLAERRKAPQDDLMSALLEARIDDQGLSEEELLGFCFNLVLGGTDTTMNLIGNGAVLLAAHPDQRKRLAENPDEIPAAIEEMLRIEAPTQILPRRTTREVELHGVTIPAESRVMVCYGAANHDERVFDAPDVFDIAKTRERHLSFGLGSHHCLGASLARLEARVAFEELLARYPHYLVHDDGGWVTSRWARSHPRIEMELEPHAAH